MLDKIEKISVIAAAVFAIFPLYQYISEADDRRLTTDALLVISYSSCFGVGAFDASYPHQPPLGHGDICDKVAKTLNSSN